MLIIFLLVMSFHFLPKILHEVLGLLMFAAMIYHFVNNWKMFRNIKKRLSKIVDVAIFLCLIVIIFTGICISNHLFNGMIEMKLQRNITIHQLHVSLPFLMMILSGLHLGLHWQGFWQRIKNTLHLTITSTLSKIAVKIIVVLLISAGIYGSILNRVGDRLLMQHIFHTEAIDLPFAAFILLTIGIFSIYVLIGVAIDKIK